MLLILLNVYGMFSNVDLVFEDVIDKDGNVYLLI